MAYAMQLDTAPRRQARLVAWLTAGDGTMHKPADLAAALGTTVARVLGDLAAVTPVVPGLCEDDAGRVGVDPELVRLDLAAAMRAAGRRP